MKFCQIVLLLLYVIYGSIVTTLIVLKECFFFVFQRKQKSVKDEIVVVTGAGHGLGRRMAISLSRLGAVVVCWDKNTETNTNTVWDIRHDGGKAHGFTCDVSDRRSVLETADKVVREVGPVTMLINNAGIYPVKAVLDWTAEELKEVFDTNIMAHFWTIKAFLPGMIERNHGHIVAIASAAALAPVAMEVPYSASKSAVTGFMDGMIQELRLNKKNKVKITCVHPYYTAVRDDIPVKFDLRIERMSPDYVAGEILKAVRQNREMISVPRFMIFWINFMKLLPQSARQMWKEDIFYCRVEPTEAVAVKTEVTVEDKFRCAEKILEVEGAAVLPVTTQAMHITIGSSDNYQTNMQPSSEMKNNMFNTGKSNEIMLPNNEPEVMRTKVGTQTTEMKTTHVSVSGNDNGGIIVTEEISTSIRVEADPTDDDEMTKI